MYSLIVIFHIENQDASSVHVQFHSSVTEMMS